VGGQLVRALFIWSGDRRHDFEAGVLRVFVVGGGERVVAGVGGAKGMLRLVWVFI
jgi:hypothetical protein